MLLNAIALPDDLYWSDESQYSAIAQTVQYSLTGALLIQEGVKQAGRYITLAGKEDMAWITRTTLEALIALANTPNTIMTLTMNVRHEGQASTTRVFDVMFRHFEGGLDIANIKEFDEQGDNSNTWFKINAIRLMEV
jgi:hypothetical protein